jgi:hypothetical protein
MPNITMKVPEDILKKARKAAVERNTTLSALVRAYLTRLAHEEEDHKEAIIAELKASYNRKNAVIGEKYWKREDLHER